MQLGKIFYTLAVNGMSEFKDDVKDARDEVSDSSNVMLEGFKKIGIAVATYFTVDKIIDFGRTAVETAANVSAEVSAFEQIMGDYANKASEKMSSVADATGVVDTRLTGYMTSMTAKFKGLGFDVETATTKASEGLTLASDAAAFWDKSLDESVSHLNSFINGSYEGGEAIGLFANDSQMAMFAVEQGLVDTTKEWSNLDEATKQATRLEYAQKMFEQSGATGQAAKEADQYANVMANLEENWRQFQSTIGEPLLQNVVTPAVEVLSGWIQTATDYVSKLTDKWKENKDIVTLAKDMYKEITDKLKSAKQWLEENETTVQMLAIAFGALTTAIMAYNIQQAIKRAGGLAEIAELALLTIQVYALDAAQLIATISTTAFGAAVNFLTSPITLVILAIGALIAIGVLLYKNWDTIKEKAAIFIEGVKSKFDDLKKSVGQKFDDIKNGIKDKIEWAKDKVKSAVDKIKKLFDFKWELPKPKIPSFKVSGGEAPWGFMGKGELPNVKIKWNAKGLILDEPRLVGAYGDTLLGAGEAGPEAIAPISELQKYLGNGNNETQTAILDTLLGILDVVQDEDRLQEILMNALEHLDLKIEMDNREFGRLVRRYA